jgi:hypothetical protein
VNLPLTGTVRLILIHVDNASPHRSKETLQVVIKAVDLIKGGNADRGILRHSDFHFHSHDPNIQENQNIISKDITI